METFLAVAGCIAAIATIYGVYIAHLSMSSGTRRKLKRHRQLLLGSLGRILASLIIFLITIMSLVVIVIYWADHEPITGHQAVMMHLHFINLIIYGSLSAGLLIKVLFPNYWKKSQAATEL